MKDLKNRTSSTLPRDEKVKLIRANENLYSGESAILKKEEILKYLNSFLPCCATTGRVYDNIMEKELEWKCDAGYCDGIYYWEETDIYHFEKYNMPLKQEFIEHCLNKLIQRTPD